VPALCRNPNSDLLRSRLILSVLAAILESRAVAGGGGEQLAAMDRADNPVQNVGKVHVGCDVTPE